MTIRTSRQLLICCTLLCFAGTTWAQCGPGEISIPADRDNTLYEDTSGSLSNGAGEYVFAGMTNNNGARRALLHFDVPGTLAPGSVVTSARLMLNMSMSIAGAQDVDLHPVLADWGEGASDAPGQEGGGTMSEPGDATWIHTFFDTSFWTTPGGDFTAAPSATASVAGAAIYTWGSTPDMVADVQGWLDAPASNFGWILLGPEGAGITAKRFDSRENTAGVPPLLCVNADLAPLVEVPTLGPAALLVLIAALGALAFRRLRPRPTA